MSAPLQCYLIRVKQTLKPGHHTQRIHTVWSILNSIHGTEICCILQCMWTLIHMVHILLKFKCVCISQAQPAQCCTFPALSPSPPCYNQTVIYWDLYPLIPGNKGHDILILSSRFYPFIFRLMRFYYINFKSSWKTLQSAIKDNSLFK